MSDNVVQMPTPMHVLSERIGAAKTRAARSRQEWIEATLELITTLAEARTRFPNDMEFSLWLVREGHDDIGKNDRAALIAMAACMEITRIILSETTRSSWRLIWEEEIQPRVPSVGKPLADSPQIAQLPAASAGTAESDAAPEQKVVNQESGSALTKRSALALIQRGEELASVFRSDKARTMLGNFPKQRGGKYILSLVLEALDAGLIPPNDLQPHQPTLSLLFPLAPAGFVRPYRLDNPKLRTQIRKMLDTMIACRPKLLAEPHRIREILAEYDAEQKDKIRAEADSKRRNDAIAQLASNQQELVVFGTTVWPRLDDKQGPYDYDQIRAAIWTFRDQLAWNKITNDNSPGSIGIRIRLSMKWYNEYLIRTDSLRENPCRRVFNLVFWLSKLYEAAPDAECKWPAYPTAEAQW